MHCVWAHLLEAANVSRSIFVSSHIHTNFSRSVRVSFPTLGACILSHPRAAFSSALALALCPRPQSHSQPQGPQT